MTEQEITPNLEPKNPNMSCNVATLAGLMYVTSQYSYILHIQNNNLSNTVTQTKLCISAGITSAPVAGVQIKKKVSEI